MSFSYELPQNNAHTSSIPFIGVQISWNQNTKICATSVYRHPAWSAVYLHYNSNSPLSHKAGCINTLLQRAHDIIKDKAVLNQEISFIINIFKYNKYPKYFIKRCINRFKDRYMKQQNKISTHTNKISENYFLQFSITVPTIPV